MLAGLPKAPSTYNPVVNPERALIRRDYVLGRMRAEDMIDEPTYRAALAQPVTAALHYSRPEAEAAYVGEMARARVQQLFGENWATAGYNVFTSIRAADQRTANGALRDALHDYERPPRLPGADRLARRADARRSGSARRGARRAARPGRSRAGRRPRGRCRLGLARHRGRSRGLARARGRRVGARAARRRSARRRDRRGRRGARRRRRRHAAGARGWCPALRAGAGRRGRLRRDGPRQRRHHRARRRFRLLPQQVQPRHPGAAPAGLDLQAVHLLRGARGRRHAGDHLQRRAGGLPRRGARGRMATVELQRALLRTDPPARGAGQVEEPRLGAGAARDRHSVRDRARRALRLRETQHAPRSLARPRQRGGHADGARARLRRVRQRRLPRAAALHRTHRGPARPRRLRHPEGDPLRRLRQRRDQPARGRDGGRERGAGRGGDERRRARLGRGRRGERWRAGPDALARSGADAAGHDRRAARARREKRLAHEQHDARGGAARHGTPCRRSARARGSRRQDRHDEQPARRLVRRIQRGVSSPPPGSAPTGSTRSGEARRAASPRCRCGPRSCGRRSPASPRRR